jgi:hypothetical protein
MDRVGPSDTDASGHTSGTTLPSSPSLTAAHFSDANGVSGDNGSPSRQSDDPELFGSAQGQALVFSMARVCDKLNEFLPGTYM